MRLTYDILTRLATVQGPAPAWMKRSRAEDLHIRLRRNGQVFSLPTGGSLRFTLSEQGKPDTTLLSVTLTPASYDEDGGTYSVVFSSVTTPINTILGAGGGSANDVPQVTCDGEIAYYDPEVEQWQPGDTFAVLLKAMQLNDNGDPAALPGVVISNNHVAFPCPDGQTRYIPLLNAIP